MKLQTAGQSPNDDTSYLKFLLSDDTGVYLKFLILMDMVVARARADAASSRGDISYPAIKWLEDMGLSVNGSTRQCRLVIKHHKKDQAGNDK